MGAAGGEPINLNYSPDWGPISVRLAGPEASPGGSAERMQGWGRAPAPEAPRRPAASRPLPGPGGPPPSGSARHTRAHSPTPTPAAPPPGHPPDEGQGAPLGTGGQQWGRAAGQSRAGTPRPAEGQHTAQAGPTGRGAGGEPLTGPLPWGPWISCKEVTETRVGSRQQRGGGDTGPHSPRSLQASPQDKNTPQAAPGPSLTRKRLPSAPARWGTLVAVGDKQETGTKRHWRRLGSRGTGRGARGIWAPGAGGTEAPCPVGTQGPREDAGQRRAPDGQRGTSLALPGPRPR